MNKGKFDFLDDTNAFLGGVTGYADKAFANVTEWSQIGLDVTTAEVYYNMSKGIEKCRQKTISALHGVFSGYLKIMAMLGPLANMSITDPLALLSPVLEVVKILTAPYYEALSIITEMTPKVIELSNNLQKIANYKPPTVDLKPSPEVSKYLVVGSITMGEIQSGVPNPVTLVKPNIDEIKELSKTKAKQKFQEATASQAEVVTGNRDKNMMKGIEKSDNSQMLLHKLSQLPKPNQRTVVDPTGEGGGEGVVNPEQLSKWEKEILGFEQPESNLAARIGILEGIIFNGQTFNGSLSARMQNLDKGIKKWRKDKAKKAQDKVKENPVTDAVKKADTGSSAIKDAIQKANSTMSTAKSITDSAKKTIDIAKETAEIDEYLFGESNPISNPIIEATSDGTINIDKEIAENDKYLFD